MCQDCNDLIYHGGIKVKLSSQTWHHQSVCTKNTHPNDEKPRRQSKYQQNAMWRCRRNRI